jgi:hypothetical protein
MKRAPSGFANIVALTAALAVSGPAIAAQSELGGPLQPARQSTVHRTQGKRVEDITDKHLGELGAFEAKEAGQPTAK